MKCVQKTINKVAVVGSGVMGSQIAMHIAQSGFKVLLLDIPDDKSDKRTQLLILHLKML